MLPYEGETGRPSDALRTKKSTRVRLMVSAYGGPNGGTVSFTRTNFDKLRLVGTSGLELPSPLHLDAGQAFFASCVCEGVEEFGCDSAGVKAVAAILKHEHRHKDIEESFPDLIDRNPDDDYDEDSVLDKDEISGRWGLVTLTNCFDTFKISYEDGMEMYRKNADNEVLARRAEESPLVYFVDRDWCNPGCQSKVRRGPDIDETDSVK